MSRVVHILPHLATGGAQSFVLYLLNKLGEIDQSIWTTGPGQKLCGVSVDFQRRTPDSIMLAILRKPSNVVFHFHWYPPMALELPNSGATVVSIHDSTKCKVTGAHLYHVATESGRIWLPDFARKYIILPLPVDSTQWYPTLNPAVRGRLVRHSYINSYKLTKNAVRDIAQYDSDRFTFLVIGDGDAKYLATINYIVEGCPHVQIVPGKNIPNRLRENWLYVYHSAPSFENFGLTIAEALACGLPVVTNDVHGGRLQLENGRFGFFCDSYREMRQKVEYLYEQPEEYNRLRANLTERNNHVLEQQFRQKMKRIYEERFDAIGR